MIEEETSHLQHKMVPVEPVEKMAHGMEEEHPNLHKAGQSAESVQCGKVTNLSKNETTTDLESVEFIDEFIISGNDAKRSIQSVNGAVVHKFTKKNSEAKIDLEHKQSIKKLGRQPSDESDDFDIDEI